MADKAAAPRPLLCFEESLELCLRPFRSADEDIVQESISLSLTDPVSFERISSPCRTVLCDHVQCFDFKCYAELNARRPQENWACPICRAKAPPEFVYVDYLFSCLLSILQHFDAATVYSSGAFEGKKPAEQKEQSGVTVIDLISDDETDQPEAKQTSGDGGNFVQKLKDFPALKDKRTMSVAQIRGNIALGSVLRLMNQLPSHQLKQLNGVGDKLAREIVLRRPWVADTEAELLEQLQDIRLVGKKKAMQIVEQLKMAPQPTQPVQTPSYATHPHAQPHPHAHAQARHSYPPQLSDALAGLRNLAQVRPPPQYQPPSTSRPAPQMQQPQQPQRLPPVHHPGHDHHHPPAAQPQTRPRPSQPVPQQPQQRQSLPSTQTSRPAPVSYADTLDTIVQFFAATPSYSSSAPATTHARPSQTVSSAAPETVYVDLQPDATTNEHSLLGDDSLLDFQQATSSPPSPDRDVRVPNVEFYATFGSGYVPHHSQAPGAVAYLRTHPDRAVDSPNKRPRTTNHDSQAPASVTPSGQRDYMLPWTSIATSAMLPASSSVATSQPCQFYAFVPPQCSYASSAPDTTASTQRVAVSEASNEPTSSQIETMDSELFDYLVGRFA